MVSDKGLQPLVCCSCLMLRGYSAGGGAIQVPSKLDRPSIARFDRLSRLEIHNPTKADRVEAGPTHQHTVDFRLGHDFINQLGLD